MVQNEANYAMSRNVGIMSWKVKGGGLRVQILTMNRNDLECLNIAGISSLICLMVLFIFQVEETSS